MGNVKDPRRMNRRKTHLAGYNERQNYAFGLSHKRRLGKIRKAEISQLQKMQLFSSSCWTHIGEKERVCCGRFKVPTQILKAHFNSNSSHPGGGGPGAGAWRWGGGGRGEGERDNCHPVDPDHLLASEHGRQSHLGTAQISHPLSRGFHKL